MQKLITSEQTHATDAFTIKERGITSIDLMESACLAFTKVFIEEVYDKETSIAILCGKGNNGADGLAIARILGGHGYLNISVYLIAFSAKETEEYKINLAHLQELSFPLVTVEEPEMMLDLKETVIIDAVLGSGLNKELQGSYLRLAELVNGLSCKVIAVDVPTGFSSEGVLPKEGIYLKADLVICFQRPKINFFFPESVQALDRFKVVPIGLDEEFIQQCDSSFQLLEASDITALVKPRKAFSHKGTYGHALIIAGQEKTMGAALLAARACLHGGAGLITLSIPDSGLTALNTSLPEVMYLSRADLTAKEIKKYKAIAIGPGFGTGEESVKVLKDLLNWELPLIVDADALNILGNRKDLFELLPPGSILTPHMKEFDHLFGTHNSWWERIETAKNKASEIGCIILLKNQYTFIVDQDGNVLINSTGNPAMAQGGMGDILTGLTASFLAQGYTNNQAAYLACYLHGKSGDELAYQNVSVTASAVAEQFPKVLKGLIK